MQQKKILKLNIAKKWLVLLTCLFLSLFLIALSRLFYLQIIKGDSLENELRLRSSDVRKLTSPRGSILDRNGQELAVSLLTKSLYVDPHEMSLLDNKKVEGTEHQRLAANLLAPILKIKADELYKTFCSDAYFVWLKRKLENSEYLQLEAIIKEHKLRGLHFQQESKRYYPQGTLAAHILGFVGSEDNGLDGLELYFNNLLSGAQEEIHLQMDAHGRPIEDSVFRKFNPSKLNRLVLTIDHNIQYVVERALDSALQKTKVQGASVIVMNPKTGEILALSNRPTYDPNFFGKFSQKEFSNRAVSYIYEPGSTYKPLVMAAALEENILSPTDMYDDKGKITILDRTINNWDMEAHGPVTYAYILTNSLNTGMVDMGMRLGGERLTSYAKKFGLGKATGIELPGEEVGILFDPKNMYPSNVATMSIGQGVALTSVQLISAIATIANDGKLVQPHIVKRIERGDGRVLKEEPLATQPQIIKPETAHTLRDIMEQVILNGGGKNAKIEGYSIAGKTGTAQKLSSDGTGYDGGYIASFVGFAPSKNPDFIVLVMLDNPQGATYYGGQIAAPVFKEIMEQLLALAEVPTENNAFNLSFNKLPSYTPPTKLLQPIFPDDNSVIMPNLQGLMYRDVIVTLRRHRLFLNPSGSGLAHSQSIAAGEKIPVNTTISVQFK
ncbi:penicillin-binding protein [Succinispira mobilis]|uniref:penicillin-binding protein n=1 Tax=Succinispira mobilis TaxID=78120 RepID=UPI00035E853E|nr:penicillin-binding protein [Succinispira mobilis]